MKSDVKIQKDVMDEIKWQPDLMSVESKLEIDAHYRKDGSKSEKYETY